MEPGVEARIREAVAAVEAAGATVEEVSLPHTDYGLATYYIVAPAEASANLARYDGVRYGFSVRGGDDYLANYLATRGQGFGAEVKRRIMLGTYALSAGYYDAFYLKAQKVRTLIKRDFDRLWEQGFDALIAPTSATVAFRFGARMADPVQMYLSDACTLPVNMAGLPGISVPCGLSEGLPVGLQLIGARLVRGRRCSGPPAPTRAITADADWRSRRAARPRDARGPGDRRRPPSAPARPPSTAEPPDPSRTLPRTHDRPRDRPRAPRRAGARPARPRGAAVGHPPVLRHPRHDGRRHQPRGGGARLRHAARDRRGGRREPARGPDALHVATSARIELRRALSTHLRAPATASTTTRRPRS